MLYDLQEQSSMILSFTLRVDCYERLEAFHQDLWALPSLWYDTRGQWACCGQFVLTVPLSANGMIKAIYSPVDVSSSMAPYQMSLVWDSILCAVRMVAHAITCEWSRDELGRHCECENRKNRPE